MKSYPNAVSPQSCVYALSLNADCVCVCECVINNYNLLLLLFCNDFSFACRKPNRGNSFFVQLKFSFIFLTHSHTTARHHFFSSFIFFSRCLRRFIHFSLGCACENWLSAMEMCALSIHVMFRRHHEYYAYNGIGTITGIWKRKKRSTCLQRSNAIPLTAYTL